MRGLEVNNKGFLCLIQDRGRYGVGQLGLSQGGALDLHGYCWANKLLNNPINASVIEITMGGASFTAHTNMTMAMTGADMFATIDNIPQANWRSFNLLKGQTLSFEFAKQGVRTYLAVKNGFDTPLILNSQATVMRNKLGGIAKENQKMGYGFPLDNDDIVPLQTDCFTEQAMCFVPAQYQRHYPHEIELNVIESYQAKQFAKAAKQIFYQAQYQVSLQSDRMGVKLIGPQIDNDLSGIISEGIAAGAIQITTDGQPIILLNDRQTLGGYPKIGCITRLSQQKLAQATANTMIKFKLETLEHASEKWLQFMRFFAS